MWVREQEFVVDRLVDGGENDDGTRSFRVRWYGYGPDSDTWEREEDLPPEFVRRFLRQRSRRGEE